MISSFFLYTNSLVFREEQEKKSHRNNDKVGRKKMKEKQCHRN